VKRIVTTRVKNILGLLAFAAVSVLVVSFIRRTERQKLRALDAVPADAFLVMTLDVDRLRKSPLGSAIFGGADSKLLGEKTLTATCGFDPLDRMREIAVAVPEEDDTGEFGIVMRADITKDELLTCAQKVMESQKGGAHASVRESGSFTLVEPDGDLQQRYPTLAYRQGGPFLVARGTWLGTMIETTEGKLPSARRESSHLALRRALGQASDDAPAFAFMATVVLPREMRERIKKEMGAEIDSATDGSASTLAAGILGVDSAGLAVLAGEAGGDTSVVAEVMCDGEAACATVAKFVERKRSDWANDFSIRLLGVGALIDHAVVDNRGTSVRISSHAPSAEAAKWLERVLELGSARHPASGPLDSAGPVTPRPNASSVEIVRAKSDGGDPRPGEGGVSAKH
jgi:hypothetical protein